MTVSDQRVKPSTMGTRIFRTAVLLAFLSGCATTVPEVQMPLDGISWSPEGPFRNQPKAEIPAEASAYNHFLRGHLSLGEGDFEAALK